MDYQRARAEQIAKALVSGAAFDRLGSWDAVAKEFKRSSVTVRKWCNFEGPGRPTQAGFSRRLDPRWDSLHPQDNDLLGIGVVVSVGE